MTRKVRKVCWSFLKIDICTNCTLFWSTFEPRHEKKKRKKMSVRPAKTQISLGIRPVWSVFAVRSVGSYGPRVSSCGQRRLWSDWADAQADLVFAGRTVTLLVLSCRGSFKVFMLSEERSEEQRWYTPIIYRRSEGWIPRNFGVQIAVTCNVTCMPGLGIVLNIYLFKLHLKLSNS